MTSTTFTESSSYVKGSEKSKTTSGRITTTTRTYTLSSDCFYLRNFTTVGASVSATQWAGVVSYQNYSYNYINAELRTVSVSVSIDLEYRRQHLLRGYSGTVNPDTSHDKRINLITSVIAGNPARPALACTITPITPGNNASDIIHGFEPWGDDVPQTVHEHITLNPNLPASYKEQLLIEYEQEITSTIPDSIPDDEFLGNRAIRETKHLFVTHYQKDIPIKPETTTCNIPGKTLSSRSFEIAFPYIKHPIWKYPATTSSPCLTQSTFAERENTAKSGGWVEYDFGSPQTIRSFVIMRVPDNNSFSLRWSYYMEYMRTDADGVDSEWDFLCASEIWKSMYPVYTSDSAEARQIHSTWYDVPVFTASKIRVFISNKASVNGNYLTPVFLFFHFRPLLKKNTKNAGDKDNFWKTFGTLESVYFTGIENSTGTIGKTADVYNNSVPKNSADDNTLTPGGNAKTVNGYVEDYAFRHKWRLFRDTNVDLIEHTVRDTNHTLGNAVSFDNTNFYIKCLPCARNVTSDNYSGGYTTTTSFTDSDCFTNTADFIITGFMYFPLQDKSELFPGAIGLVKIDHTGYKTYTGNGRVNWFMEKSGTYAKMKAGTGAIQEALSGNAAQTLGVISVGNHFGYFPVTDIQLPENARDGRGYPLTDWLLENQHALDWVAKELRTKLSWNSDDHTITFTNQANTGAIQDFCVIRGTKNGSGDDTYTWTRMGQDWIWSGSVGNIDPLNASPTVAALNQYYEYFIQNKVSAGITEDTARLISKYICYRNPADGHGYMRVGQNNPNYPDTLHYKSHGSGWIDVGEYKFNILDGYFSVIPETPLQFFCVVALSRANAWNNANGSVTFGEVQVFHKRDYFDVWWGRENGNYTPVRGRVHEVPYSAVYDKYYGDHRSLSLMPIGLSMFHSYQSTQRNSTFNDGTGTMSDVISSRKAIIAGNTYTPSNYSYTLGGYSDDPAPEASSVLAVYVNVTDALLKYYNRNFPVLTLGYVMQ